MQKTFPKTIGMMLAVCLTLFMASSAMAITVDTKSEEMIAYSTRDQAGTVKLILENTDWDIIWNYINVAGNPFVELRLNLSGTDIDPGATPPFLARAIVGGDDISGLGGPVDTEQLDVLGVEMSDIDGDTLVDFTAYVHGPVNQRIISIYITALPGANYVALWDVNIDGVVADEEKPWLRIGLYDELIVIPDEDTAICANVQDFGGLSKLIIDKNAIPETLTFSVENQIGHFAVAEVFSCRNCEKVNEAALFSPDCIEDTSIELCAVGEQDLCDNYEKCIYVDGPWPTSQDIVFTIRTNGDSDTATTQDGIGLWGIKVVDELGNLITPAWTYYDADGTTTAPTTDCTFDIWKMSGTINTASFTDIYFCVNFEVDADTAVSGSNVRFWVAGEILPCTAVFSCGVTGPQLIDCQTGVTPVTMGCVYHPYVVQNLSPWFTGFTFACTDGTDPANIDVCMVLGDAAGVDHAYNITGLGSAVMAWSLDDILGNFDGGTVAAGPAWLRISANCAFDSYEFVTDTVWGGATLSRSCSYSTWSTWCP
jgi:hypothetical protein